ncbi:3-hydroxyacyl-CoA dehydrogenase NAD-binding domain-containing protein [Cupriavidus basilensis]|uniref:3-hydroxyacyl-CoA dehydrogenase NAD-binding domain-containing protein n=1 Tax=Cupriavidus basilensis TaxID=68895 RepID=UPI00157AB022|nr:3-hydroxyacyl-CoA dehydrogenase NAD-binding domain-containing protein [Cupriavidus basilensis]NUA30607.1 3-hydroxyacyl-CoA dehydrogenase [Cupriavidus basilensis]
MSIQYTVIHDVGVISIANPPINGLGYDVRVGIIDGMDRAAADDNVRAIVLTGAGKAFSGGADMHEFNSPEAWREPGLNTVLVAIENSAKPVVAAVHSVAMGGGLELALACHYRVAVPKARIALSEVTMGLLPGAGGTQRLPRLIGLEAATNMIVHGTSIPSEVLADSGLFDRLVEGDVVTAAVAFAQEVAARPGPHPKVRDLTILHPNPEGYLAVARPAIAARYKNLQAPLRCLDAIEASFKLPFDEGLALERRLFLELMNGPVSKSLRHAFFSERAAAKLADVPDSVPVRVVNKVAVVGAGLMGSGIAMNFLSAAIPVVLLDISDEAVQTSAVAIRRNYEASLKKGKLRAEVVEERMALLQPTVDLGRVADCDLVIEAVYEDMDVKLRMFRALDEIARPGAILATNTSMLDVDRIAAETGRPQDVIGLHFFSPANVMRLLEVVRGAKTAPDVLQTAMRLARRIGKVPVVSGLCDGFIGNRMLATYIRRAGELLEQGALPEQVDRAIEEFGLAMGPFRMADLAGNDIGWAIRKRHYAEDPSRPRFELGDRLCEAGHFGQKTGAGWYDYEPGQRKALPSARTRAMLEAYWGERGVTPMRFSTQEIVERLIYALVNEGAAVLEEGVAARASDIDAVYLHGYGFPAWRGGPMFYADTVGVTNVRRTLRALSAQDPSWKPAALIEQLADEGRTFNT